MNPKQSSYGTLVNQNSFDQETAVVTKIPYSKNSILLKLKSNQASISISTILLGAFLVFIVFASVPEQDSILLDDNNAVMSRVLKAENDIIETTTMESSRGRGRGRGNSTREPTVRISQGRLRGKVLQSRAGRDYNAFYTIPYGKPPIGNLRFQPPEEAKPWSGTRDATQKGPMCIQQERYNPNKNIVGSEDCLYLHLYTPKLPQRQRFGRQNQNQTNALPVISYFFGGGFMHGTANDFSGDYFMDEDVIVVLVESRVGALGFLNTEDLAATGNQGLKDQTLAMKWVKKNVDKFGGDPNKIIAFGTSSGASCAQAHLLSPMNSGIISGVMSFSGTVMSPPMFDFNPRKAAVELGKALNCSDVEDSFNLVKCLQNASAIDIGYYQPDFHPSVEAIPLDGNMTNTFLPDTPTNMFKTGNFNKVPWLTGVNSAEAISQSYTILLNPTQVDNLNENWDNEISKLLQFEDNSEKQYSHKIHEFYFGDQKVSNDTRYNLTNLMSDRIWVHPASLSSKLITEHNSTVFLYYLTKEANVSWAADVTQYFDPPYGVSHADEVQYFFPRPRYPYIPLDSEYAEFSKMLVKFWVTFADKGTPIGPVDWPPVNINDAGLTFYNLDDEPKLIQPVTKRMQFWNSLPLDIFY